MFSQTAGVIRDAVGQQAKQTKKVATDSYNKVQENPFLKAFVGDPAHSPSDAALLPLGALGRGVKWGKRGAEAATDAAKTADEGIYVIRGARGAYIGQSGNIEQRFSQHLVENGGRFTRQELNVAERFTVPGGKTAREIAEQGKIDELGGIGNLLSAYPVGSIRAV